MRKSLGVKVFRILEFFVRIFFWIFFRENAERSVAEQTASQYNRPFLVSQVHA
jgi:hypothetical protein